MISLRQGSSLVTTSLRFTRQSHGISQNISTTSYAGASQQNDGNWSSPVPVEEVRRFVVDSMVKVGTIEDHATALADVLVAADYRGHYSHGLNRLEMYIQDASSGICESNAEPEIINSKFATAFVDGKNSLGPVVGNFCMKLAIEKAKQFGVGWVAANNSNHYGIAGWYSMQAANEGLMGLSFTNTSPFLQPTRAKGVGSLGYFNDLGNINVPHGCCIVCFGNQSNYTGSTWFRWRSICSGHGNYSSCPREGIETELLRVISRTPLKVDIVIATSWKFNQGKTNRSLQAGHPTRKEK